MNPANPSTAHATVVVDELVRCGVTDAVLCPGSRNAPLAFALHAADAAGRLRLHVRVDERTAAFLALGLAVRSGRPVPVCTTSGTAVANLHPAVLEASHAGVPLLVLSADRPPSMIGTGANQTVVQPGMFGDAVRLAVNAGDAAWHGVWRSQVCRAVAASTGATGLPGPVHMNLPFAEPLVPDGGEVPSGRPGGAPWTAVAPVRRSSAPLPLDPAAPTLIVAGHGAPAEVAAAGVPVIAEPSAAPWSRELRISSGRLVESIGPGVVRTGPWLLGLARELRLSSPRVPQSAAASSAFRGGELRVSSDGVSSPIGSLWPAQVVVAGRPTLHRAVQRLLADPEVAVYALDGPAPWADVAGTVRAVGSLPPLQPPDEWLAGWEAADKAAAAALDAALDDPVAPGGLRLARALVAALPTGALLTLGSSNPVRDVSLAAVPRPGLTVLANRGVAGIDGTVSTACGAALAHDGPAYALLGDLTLLHDTTGLLSGPEEPRPDVTLVVLNDRGGGIFGLLEQGAPEHADAFERVFGTPHDVDLGVLCDAFGVTHRACTDLTELPEALAPAPGVRLVEVRGERARLRAGHAALRAAVAAAVV
ncbi:2-succinyl-5-enolpyruvyl-6-hydroxy-3-cyclohexene-1-carboxylate synthase [Pseudonocardia sp.]|uniref:2-succinyl-5-enolpyruvyl-6-hydroxy-3- cyclohexene-1-carboxylate synthase n=1 Tax=Pseudonocardia sp. TaxID=60912 RepID=UPI003D09E459